MCYDISYLSKKQSDYAKRYGNEEDWKDILKRLPPAYHKNGFQHPEVPVVTDISGGPELFNWGLIPFWIKTEEDAIEISNKTINARGETLFEKASFRKAAANQRCLVIIDGFFESHHFQGKTYPYFIYHKDESPIILGGVYDNWVNKKTGEELNTFSIVTTVANKRMQVIHNNPKVLKRGGPRMPLLLKNDQIEAWLDDNSSKEDINKLIAPYPTELLKDYTVSSIRGNRSYGNAPEALQPMNYPELTNKQQTLF